LAVVDPDELGVAESEALALSDPVRVNAWAFLLAESEAAAASAAVLDSTTFWVALSEALAVSDAVLVRTTFALAESEACA
jgi:hypothetical protein